MEGGGAREKRECAGGAKAKRGWNWNRGKTDEGATGKNHRGLTWRKNEGSKRGCV